MKTPKLRIAICFGICIGHTRLQSASLREIFLGFWNLRVTSLV